MLCTLPSSLTAEQTRKTICIHCADVSEAEKRVASGLTHVVVAKPLEFALDHAPSF
jgi:hypothetical protein